MTAKTGRILIVDDEPEAVATIERAGNVLMLEVATLDHTGPFERLVTEWQLYMVVLDVGISYRVVNALPAVLSSLKFKYNFIITCYVPKQVTDSASQVGRMRGLHVIGTSRKPVAYDVMHALIAEAEAAE